MNAYNIFKLLVRRVLKIGRSLFKSMYFIKNTTIKAKISFAFITMIVISSLLIVYASYALLSRTITLKIDNSIYESLEQSMQSIDYKLKDIESIYFYAINNKKLRDMFERTPITESEKELFSREFIGALEVGYDESIYYSIIGDKTEHISSVYFFGNNGLTLVSNSSPIVQAKLISDVKQTSIYQKARKAERRAVWTVNPVDMSGSEEYSNYNISCGRIVCRLNDTDFNEWGLMVINIRESFIYDSYKNFANDREAVFIVDQDHTVISHPDKTHLFKPLEAGLIRPESAGKNGKFEYTFQGEKSLVYYATSKQTHWKIYRVIPKKLVMAELDTNKQLMYYLYAFVLVIFILIASAISASISRPLIMLVKNMNRVKEGNLNIKVDMKRSDEFGLLAESFNKMTERINSLMKKVDEDNRRIRQSEFRALQAQINPHFLYNTLDMIYWHARSSEYEKVQQMILSLAKFFRLGLNNGRDMTTVEREISHAESYLLLNKLRNNRNFDYFVMVDEAVKKCECIKLIVQPLVENALIHGLKNNQEQGLIHIYGKKEDDCILLEVYDNGCGMEQAQLDKLFGSKEEKPADEPSGGYALRNVNERVQLLYGEKYGLSVQSEVGKYTLAQIRIPVRAV